MGISNMDAVLLPACLGFGGSAFVLAHHNLSIYQHDTSTRCIVASSALVRSVGWAKQAGAGSGGNGQALIRRYSAKQPGPLRDPAARPDRAVLEAGAVGVGTPAACLTNGPLAQHPLKAEASTYPHLFTWP
jgi:hypothetical protein